MFCLSLFRRCFGRYAEFHEEIPVEWEDRVSPISVVDSIDTTKVLNGCEKNKFSLGPDLEDGDCLQKGSFATVYRCTSKSPHLETEVAVKVYEFNYWYVIVVIVISQSSKFCLYTAGHKTSVVRASAVIKERYVSILHMRTLCVSLDILQWTNMTIMSGWERTCPKWAKLALSWNCSVAHLLEYSRDNSTGLS